MFIKPAQAREKNVSFSVSMPESQGDTLKKYVEYASRSVGYQVPVKEVIRLLIEAGIAKDGGFHKYLKKRDNPEGADVEPSVLPAEPENADEQGYSFN
ncbi:hypothetical protein ACJU26_09255 [Acidithiobacillus sp. M4-SHS-6]|uniref:hypothetical protein n=1 Tax=Acidithiobacillus sp. M4-SHS-6 TaxID=3383024 RepID=UPI0039BE4A3F